MKITELVALAKLISLIREKNQLFTFMVDWKPFVDFLHETNKKNERMIVVLLIRKMYYRKRVLFL